jgi:signal transduction histidine kinase
MRSTAKEPRLYKRKSNAPSSGESAIDWAIAVSRLVLATGGLAAAYLDPEQPSGGGGLGYTIFAAYVGFALALLVFYRRLSGPPWKIATHCLEVALVSLIILTTEGPSSPFFVYFTFVLLIAALRWQWQGTLATGGFLSLLLIVLTASQLLVHFEQADVDRLIIRNVYLLVVTCLFAFLGNHFRRQSQELERLVLAQNIHDGILQTLTAVALRLRALAEDVTGELQSRVIETMRLLNAEQRRMRVFVSDTRHAREDDPGPNRRLAFSQLKTEIERLRRLWDCKIEFAAPEDLGASVRIGSALKLILAESVANAVVHGKAERMAISITRQRTMLHIQIADDGCGLPVGEGVYDLQQLNDGEIGPRSTCRRVESVNGRLRLHTSDHGVILYIQLPTLVG